VRAQGESYPRWQNATVTHGTLSPSDFLDADLMDSSEREHV
jgi:hypothetical protein